MKRKTAEKKAFDEECIYLGMFGTAMSALPLLLQLRNTDSRKFIDGLRNFGNQLRNPIYDLGSIDSGRASRAWNSLPANECHKSKNKKKDHYIPRAASGRRIMKAILSGRIATVQQLKEFIAKNKCREIITLTGEEHDRVTAYCRNKPYVHWRKVYAACGVKIEAKRDRRTGCQ